MTTIMRVLLLTVVTAIFSLHSAVQAARPKAAVGILTNLEKELDQLEVSGAHGFEEEQQYLRQQIEDINVAQTFRQTPHDMKILKLEIRKILRRGRQHVKFAKDKRSVKAMKMLNESRDAIVSRTSGECRGLWDKLFYREIQEPAWSTYDRLKSEQRHSSDDKEAQQVYAKIEKFHTFTDRLRETSEEEQVLNIPEGETSEEDQVLNIPEGETSEEEQLELYEEAREALKNE